MAKRTQLYFPEELFQEIKKKLDFRIPIKECASWQCFFQHQ